MSEERRTPRQYLNAETIANVVIFVVVLTVIAALGVSRASDNLLAPGALAVIVTVIGVVAGLTGRPIGIFEGAHAVLFGDVDGPIDGPDEHRLHGDPFDARRLRWTSLGWAAALAVWAGAAGLLVAAVLRGKHAPFVVAAVVLVLVGGAATVVGGLVGRAEGLAAAAAARPTSAIPLRRRAWREIALPMAVVQAFINGAMAVLLFHDYATGDPLAPKALTKSIARADALIVVVILTALFGYLATRWGQVDAALGRVVAEPTSSAVDAKHPIGAQGLVYVAFAGLIAFSLAGWLLPPLPSLLRVVLVRAGISGLLAFAVCGVSHVRGALNTLAGATPPTSRPALGAPRLGRGTALATQVVLVLVVGAAVVRTAAVAPSAVADSGEAAKKQLAAEGDAFVARLEYDIPLPVSTGSIARVIGRAGPPSGSNSYGLAASPSHLDPVVGGYWANPVSDEDPTKPGDQHAGPVPIPDENHLPQVECFYPGNSVNVRFNSPTDARDDLKSAPTVGYATAQCDGAPEAEVHSRVAEFGGAHTVTQQAAALITTGPAGADGLYRPLHGVLEGKTKAWAHDVSLLGGAIHIDSVAVDGASAVSGLPGAQRTLARVTLHNVDVGGTTFSLEGDRLMIGGQPQALDSLPARQMLDAADAALASTGCQLKVVGPTQRYPQGYVLSRKPPPIGLKKDGSLASSMAAGLLVLCDIPQTLSEPTGFNPQRLQILVGFVYTSAIATDKVGGFGLGDLVGLAPVAPSVPSQPPASAAIPEIDGAVTAPPVEATPAANVSAPPAETPAVRRPIRAAFVAVAGVFGKWPIWLAALAVWLVVTRRGLRRVHALIADVERAS